MKNKLLIIGLICTSIASFSQTNEQRYYYAFNRKIFLNEVENKMVVCFQSKYAADAKARLQTERAIQKNDSVCILYAENSQRAILRRDLLQLKGVKSVQPMYEADGIEVGMTDKFIKK